MKRCIECGEEFKPTITHPTICRDCTRRAYGSRSERPQPPRTWDMVLEQERITTGWSNR
jgi:hypothetical protein